MTEITVVVNKGGKGSGFRDHRGIPDHQGGSLPEKGKAPVKRKKRAKAKVRISKPPKESVAEEPASKPKESTSRTLEGADWYTSDGIGAMDLNDALRAGKKLEPLQERMRDSLAKQCMSNTVKDEKLFRGMLLPQEDIQRLFREGHVTEDRGFMSTTSDYKVADDFAKNSQYFGSNKTKKREVVIMVLKIPKGMHGYTVGDTEENSEVILPPGTKYEVTAVNVRNSNKGRMYQVVVEVQKK